MRYLSNDIGVMYLGKLVEVGPANKVYGSPAHPYTKGLIDAAPVADPQAEKAKVRAGVAGEVPSAITPPSLCRFRTRCPFAQDRCAEEEPLLRSFGPAHFAACHFPADFSSARRPRSRRPRSPRPAPPMASRESQPDLPARSRMPGCWCQVSVLWSWSAGWAILDGQAYTCQTVQISCQQGVVTARLRLRNPLGRFGLPG